MGEIFTQQHIGTVVIDWAAFLLLFALVLLNVFMVYAILVLASVRRWLKRQVN